ncbi:IS3 family transposase [Zunongwangia sp.]|uniref:IS3 family transposase n=1 Tax=Zunongwangia sp. TaxID=1965325 RepID=UPI003AA9943C
MEHSLFTDLIKKEFDLSKQRYGSTRIAEKLKREGYCISRCRVAKIMRANHWVRNTNGSLRLPQIPITVILFVEIY